MKPPQLILFSLLGMLSQASVANDNPDICANNASHHAILPDQQPVRPLTQPFSEADMLPVRSLSLSPGTIEPRTINARGLSPIFIIGDDPRSHAWLRHRAENLQSLRAVGLVVNVDTVEGLAHLRQLAPGLSLSPVAADDLAQRLAIRHYPVLITATSIEQ